ncbi:hypothetical protein ACFC4G_41490 [Streptomyces sp. NPDC056002]|uniref:hypothetical protein n=1 Tax=Streptomyces sp. NPDC056002 TaxID=3345675 RepID=UPI0035D77D91
MNTGDLWPDPDGAWLRVRRMQTKLHQWAVDDPDRRFDDLYNLVHHPDFLTVAWERVRGNKGARTAGVDRVIPAFIASESQDRNGRRGQISWPHDTAKPLWSAQVVRRTSTDEGLSVPAFTE